jgi:hypothetical protein
MAKPTVGKRPSVKRPEMVKTTLRFEEGLWREAQHLAVERSPDATGRMVSFQDIVNEALRAYLSAKGKKEART